MITAGTTSSGPACQPLQGTRGGRVKGLNPKDFGEADPLTRPSTALRSRTVITVPDLRDHVAPIFAIIFTRRTQ